MSVSNNDNHDTWVVTEEGAVIDIVATPPLDAARVLADIGEQLQDVIGHPDHSAAAAIEMVEAADWRGRNLVNELSARYLEGGTDTESEEQARVREVISLYLSRLASAYVGLVRLFQTYSRGWAEVGDKLPRIIARAIRATALRLKWQRMRYRPVEADIWQTLSQLWSYVEDKGLTRARVLVYEDRSTLQREFLRPLMFAMSGANNLPPVEVDVVEKMIAHCAERFELQQYPTKSCHFFVDIDQWTPAARYRPDDVARPGTRYFGPGDAAAGFEAMSAQLAEGTICTNEFNFHQLASVDVVVEMLAHLERHWSVKRPERRDERRRTRARLAIVSGYNEIVERITSHDASVRAKDDGAESWGVENESESGYGAVLPNERGEKLRVGELIAVRPFGSRVWGVGIIRRLAAHDTERRYVGIELLARGVQAVPLSNVRTGERTLTGLLLPSSVGASVGQGEINLLLPLDGFSRDFSLEMELYDNYYFLDPRMVMETGEDFEVARYLILDQSD